MWYEKGRDELHKAFWWGNLKERNHVGNLVIDGRTLNWIDLAMDRDNRDSFEKRVVP